MLKRTILFLILNFSALAVGGLFTNNSKSDLVVENGMLKLQSK